MEESKYAEARHELSLQEYLSLGYVYLILLGITGDVIYYKFLGINILNYSSISDILMGPITTLIADYRILLTVVVMMSAVYFLYTWLLPTFHKKNRDKQWYRKAVKDIDKIDATYASFTTGKRIFMVIVFFTAMFIGIKIGSGRVSREKLETGEIKMTHSVVFTDGTTRIVRMIGQNSSFIFYLTEGQKEVSITPISGNIREIKTMKKTDE